MGHKIGSYIRCCLHIPRNDQFLATKARLLDLDPLWSLLDARKQRAGGAPKAQGEQNTLFFPRISGQCSWIFHCSLGWWTLFCDLSSIVLGQKSCSWLAARPNVLCSKLFFFIGSTSKFWVLNIPILRVLVLVRIHFLCSKCQFTGQSDFFPYEIATIRGQPPIFWETHIFQI